MTRTTATAFLLVAASLAFACGAGPASTATHEPAPGRARVATIERVEIAPELEIAGTVEAEISSYASSRVMALVTSVPARLGDRVRRGQLLVSIDPTAAQGQVSQAEGALAQAEAALALAQRNHGRFTSLAETDSASALELDLATMQLDQAKGAVEQAKGAVAAARSVARESQVVAPFDGVVAARMVDVGDLAAPGRPLVRVDSLEGRRLVVEVPERLAAASALAAGTEIPFAIDARPELGRGVASIVELAPGPDPMTHTVTVKLELVGEALPAGSAGRAWFRGSVRPAVLVPADALIASGGLDLVVVRDEEGRARSRVVTVGATHADGRVEVLSGLSGDERVLVGLGSAPAAGAPVEEVAG